MCNIVKTTGALNKMVLTNYQLINLNVKSTLQGKICLWYIKIKF